MAEEKNFRQNHSAGSGAETITSVNVHDSPGEIILSCLQRYFGHSSFRGCQKEAVEAVLQGRDVVVILPTGGGKSLCYQLSAMVKDGITVVISPLIALVSYSKTLCSSPSLC